MRPGLTREIVRNGSAYKLARHIVDGFLIANLLALVIGCVGVCAQAYQQPEPDKLTIAGACFGVIVFGAASILCRELAQAFFDIADCALLKSKAPREDDNPFK